MPALKVFNLTIINVRAGNTFLAFFQHHSLFGESEVSF